MTTPSNPSEIARETLRQLALKRIPPTPDNYVRLYAQISGVPAEAREAFPEAQLTRLRIEIERHDNQSPAVRNLEASIGAQDWPGVQESVVALIQNQDGAAWRALLPALLKEWSRPQQGLTPAQKATALERALGKAKTTQSLVHELRDLVQRWSQPSSRSGAAAIEAAPGGDNTPDDGTATIKQLLSQLLDIAVAGLANDNGALAAEARQIGQRLQASGRTADLAAITPDLKRLCFRLELALEDRDELNAAVLHLLQLLVDNISEIVIDDEWLRGQIAVVKTIVDSPRNQRAIDDAERRIKDVIIRQSALKSDLLASRDAMKDMLSGFVKRLADFAEDTSSYHDRIESCAERIARATDIRDLDSVVREVMQETRTIILTAQRSRDELREARSRVEEAERRIAQLQDELGRTSELVSHDQLTSALNRRGLEEVFDKEIARAARHRSTICIAVLDIDDFKKLNDSFGHQAGDAALVHLTSVIRDCLRPQDSVARYGGEEFVIIFPDTQLDEGKQALVRLQRELTKKFFLHENQKLLITFSAGVTQLDPDSTPEQAIRQADELMYQAKRAGKNRVVAN